MGQNEGYTYNCELLQQGDATTTGTDGTVGGLVADERRVNGTITTSYFDYKESTATDGVGTGTHNNGPR